MARRSAPEVNAGSMADIAFLLLIFFLVTTTIESDKGISRKLPPIQDENQVESVHKEKNIFMVIINKNGDLLVRDKPMDIKDLRKAAEDFIDNGGGTGSKACSYCQGKRNPDSSENPKKALISIQYDRQTKYGKYIAVQNEIMAAFNDLRDRVSNNLFNEDFRQLTKDLKDASSDSEKKKIKEKIKEVRKLYPLNISEAKPEQV